MKGSSDKARLVVVPDTKALLRVASAKAARARAMRDAWEQRDSLLVISDEILKELGRVLRYPRVA